MFLLLFGFTSEGAVATSGPEQVGGHGKKLWDAYQNEIEQLLTPKPVKVERPERLPPKARQPRFKVAHAGQKQPARIPASTPHPMLTALLRKASRS